MKTVSTNRLERLERILFAALLISLPFQTRLKLTTFGTGEWQEAWLWLSDVVVISLVALWLVRGVTRDDLMPMLFLVAFIPAYAVHPTGLALVKLLKIAEGLFLLSYIKSRRAWLMRALARPRIFFLMLSGLIISAVAGVAQYWLQHDLGLNTLFGESPLDAQADGVAKLFVGGAKVIRAYGFTPHPNILGALLAAGVIIVAFLYVFRGVGRSRVFSAKRQREEVFRGLILFTLLLGLLLTFSRVSWVAGVVGLAVLIGMVLFRAPLRRIYSWEVLRLAIVGTVAAATLIVVFWPILTARLDMDISSEQAFSLRSFYAEESFSMIADKPLFGVGLGEFTEELAERNPSAPDWSMQPVHNVSLLVAAEAGLPAAAAAIVAFVLLMVAAFRRLKESHDPGITLIRVLAFALGCLVLLLSLGDHLLWTSQQGSLLVWIILGLLA